MIEDPGKDALLRETKRAASRERDPSLAKVPGMGRLLLLAGHLGWSVALPLVVAAWGGHALDRYFGTGIQIAAAAIVAAAVFGFVSIWRRISK